MNDLHDRQDEQIWYEIHDWKKRDRYDMNCMIERRWTDMKWFTWMIEIWMYYDLHEWLRYMDMLWFTWMIEIYRYIMIYMNDRDIWMYYDLHEW